MKESLSLMEIEAYAMSSSTYLPNDSHTFVSCKEDRNREWRNHGGGWNDPRPKTFVAKAEAFKEWLLYFVPPGAGCDECGVSFGENGVCHTYANRELLLSFENASVQIAAKDEYVVMLFGKYGLGIQQLKDRLRATYHHITQSISDPFYALDRVLGRIDSSLDEELMAWYRVATQEGIPVDGILRLNHEGGIAMAKIRFQALRIERENLYQRYVESGRQTNFRHDLKALMKRHCKDYLTMLCAIRYISEQQKFEYFAIVDRVFDTMIHTIENTLLRMQRNELL